MKVISKLGTIKFKKTAVAIGIFDGIHRGHQLLIKGMVAQARKLKSKAVVITFFPHPAHVLRPEMPLPYLMTLKQRLSYLQQLGADAVIVIPFNQRFASIDPQVFISDILVKQLGVKAVFVGENFRFGKDRKGDVAFFKEMSKLYGYKMHALKTLTQNKERVSSGRLRKIVPAGELKQAAQLLGRPFSVIGKVVKGSARGRELGYPTANVQYQSDVLPPKGVYAVQVVWKNKLYNGMANLGVRPSFKEGKPKLHLEVHLFDFKSDLYNQEIQVNFLKKIREEKAFPSKETLISQICKDESSVRLFLKN